MKQSAKISLLIGFPLFILGMILSGWYFLNGTTIEENNGITYFVGYIIDENGVPSTSTSPEKLAYIAMAVGLVGVASMITGMIIEAHGKSGSERKDFIKGNLLLLIIGLIIGIVGIITIVINVPNHQIGDYSNWTWSLMAIGLMGISLIISGFGIKRAFKHMAKKEIKLDVV